MTDYPRHAARLFNTPLLVTPEAASTVADYLAARIAGEAVQLRAAALDGGDPSDDLYAIDADGIATIPIHGELVNRGDWMDALSGLTSYKTIASALDAAAKDTRVRGIVLDLDSPGGEAAGAMETAAKVRAVSQQKRVVAYVDSLAASAAYAIASGADEIVATPSATIGSIGVVWLHLDRSKAMAERGVKPTLLHAGAYKIDGHSMGALPDDARARIQAQIDQVYGLFVETVGQHRPKLGADGARKTEAGIFFGQSAVEAGLADRVGGLDALKSSFPRNNLWSLKMPDEAVHTQAAFDAAVAAARADATAAATAVATTAAAEAFSAGATAERTRIAAILDHAEAQGREKTARKLAFTTALTVEAAADFLKDLPKAEGRRDLGAVVPRPNVGGGDGGDGGVAQGVAGEMADGARAAQALLASIGAVRK